MKNGVDSKPFSVETIAVIRSKLKVPQLLSGLLVLILLLGFDVKADPVFVVAGRVQGSTGLALAETRVQVENLTNTSVETKESITNANGLYKILFMDMFGDGDLDHSFIDTGDRLKVRVLDSSDVSMVEHSWIVTPQQITDKIVEINLQLFSLVEDLPQTISFSPIDNSKTVARYTIIESGNWGQLSDFDSVAGQVLYSPVANYSGTDTLVVGVDYVTAGSSEIIVKISISPINDSPVVKNPIADITIDEDAEQQTIFLIDVFADADIETNQDQLSFTASGGETLLDIGLDGEVLSFQPLEDQNGTAIVSIIATDIDGSIATNELAITIRAINDEPFVANPVDDISVWTGSDDVIIDLTSIFSDPDITSLPIGDQETTDVLTIAGKIWNSEGSPLSGLMVQITHQTQLETLPTSVTNSDGIYKTVLMNIDQAGSVASQNDNLLIEVFDDSGGLILTDNYQLTNADITQKLADISFRGDERINWFSIRESLDFEYQIAPIDQPFVTATINDQNLILDITDDLSLEGEIEFILRATDMSLTSSPPESFKVQITASALEVVGVVQGELRPEMYAYATVYSDNQERFNTLDDIVPVDTTSGEFTILLYEDVSQVTAEIENKVVVTIEDDVGNFLAETKTIVSDSHITSTIISAGLTIEDQPTRTFEVVGVGNIGLQLPDVGTRLTTKIESAQQEDVEAILPASLDLAQRTPEQMIKIEVAGDTLDTGIGGNFQETPLRISLPFISDDQVADTIVLLSEPTEDQESRIEILATEQGEDNLTADLYHLSYLLTIKNQSPRLIDDWQTTIISNSVQDSTTIDVNAGDEDIEIDLQLIFTDDDLDWGDNLIYQLSLPDTNLISVPDAVALDSQSGFEYTDEAQEITQLNRTEFSPDFETDNTQLKIELTKEKSQEGEVSILLRAVDINGQVSPTIELKVNVKSTQPSAWQTELELTAGLNLVSLPLQPIDNQTKQPQSWAAADLAERIQATVVVAYDSLVSESNSFVPYIPEVMANSGDSGFLIDEDQSYIVNVLENQSYVFIGQPWGLSLTENHSSTNAETIDPPTITEIEEASPAPALQKRLGQNWAFVLSGEVVRDSQLSVGFEQVQIGQIKAIHQPTGQALNLRLKGNRFNTVLTNMNQQPVVNSGDVFEVTALDQAGNLIAGPNLWPITDQDLTQAYHHQSLTIGDIVPNRSMLLANYPNPFNPETWIPYELSQDGSVTVQIFDSQGTTIRNLRVGYRSAGRYLSQSRAVYWDGKNQIGETVATGMYFYTLTSKNFSASRRMVIIK